MEHARKDRLILLVTLALGVLGLLISWIAFAEYAVKHGPDLSTFWFDALTTFGLKGLTYDLIASGAIVTVWALAHYHSLGITRVAAICLTTWVLGVCGGLALWALFRPTSINT